MDSNHRPHAYQACALTTWATSPYHNNMLCLSHTDYNFGRSGRTWTHDIRFWRPTFYHWTTLLWYVMTEKEGFEPSHPYQIYSLSRGASSATWVLLHLWRRGWDSNPRGLTPKRFSRPPRYDRFDTSPLWWSIGDSNAGHLD